ncbi:SCP-like extracellular [Kribbella flavida DSM 17836]|uniref:SCP-like extracellular n=1 Tax=Kribbella flavida (strain DSM 17836 / JCM 10339 / NBRC 14399) TaxID=479435 RepID=D2Q484_KRIFD|nr:CAP domain-containing protein [Kribbella flavida]ADB30398.1 SCP-like extracellular [Kribbella flavida DSM 17836]
MTDSPTPGRHRGRRAAPRRSRGLVGPVVSSLSVLLAIGPVVWLMTNRDGSAVADNDATKVLNVAEDNSGPAAVDDSTSPGAPGKTGKPQATVTATLPNGMTTTITPSGTPTLGTAESTPGTPVTGGPTTVITSLPGGVTTVTVRPSGPPTIAGGTAKPKPRPASSKPTTTTTTTTTTSTPPPTTEPTPDDPPPGGGGTNAQEREVLELTNQARRRQGCRPLQLDDSLVEAAGRHASDMVRRHYLDHTNPDGQGPGDRIQAAGFRGSGWGENIAAGYESPQRVVAAWMNSDGHRANILNCKYNRIGIGFDPGQVKSDWGSGSWVQDFGRVSS